MIPLNFLIERSMVTFSPLKHDALLLTRRRAFSFKCHLFHRMLESFPAILGQEQDNRSQSIKRTQPSPSHTDLSWNLTRNLTVPRRPR